MQLSLSAVVLSCLTGRGGGSGNAANTPGDIKTTLNETEHSGAGESRAGAARAYTPTRYVAATAAEQWLATRAGLLLSQHRGHPHTHTLNEYG